VEAVVVTLVFACELLVPFIPPEACVAAVSIDDLVVVRDVGLELGAALRMRFDAFGCFTGECDRCGDDLWGEDDRAGEDEGGRVDLSVSPRGLADAGNGAGGGGIFCRAGEASGFWPPPFFVTVNRSSLLFSGSPRLHLQSAGRNVNLSASRNWPYSSYIAN
jgi:hypothetical protein